MESALRVKQDNGFTQFELTNFTLNNLSQFNLTPTAKLVLLYLTTCYNPEHKEVFPKQQTIADKLGISLMSVIRAIQELHKEGLILSERKISNRYVFTSRIASERSNILKDTNLQKESSQTNKLLSPYKEQKRETKKEQTVFLKGGNVYSDDDRILEDYAKKHNAKSVQAYVNKLKSSGSANKIICEYKKRNFYTQRALHSCQETQKLIESWKNIPYTCKASECGFSLSQLGFKK